jgi:cytochrome c-type biogenesis protein CcmF
MLTYVGYKPTPDGKFLFDVNVEREGESFQLSPVMFDAGQQGMMKNPDMASFLTSDFYISPISLEQPQHDLAEHAGDVYTIEKGKSVAVGDYKATFVKFDMNAHSESAMQSGGAGEMAVGSVLEVTDGQSRETITPVTVYGTDGRQTSKPTESRLLNATVQLVSMNVGGMGSNTSTVTIGVQRGQGARQHNETLVIEASIKPFIGLVWAGTLVMFGGFAIAMMKRLQEA